MQAGLDRQISRQHKADRNIAYRHREIDKGKQTNSRQQDNRQTDRQRDMRITANKQLGR